MPSRAYNTRWEDAVRNILIVYRAEGSCCRQRICYVTVFHPVHCGLDAVLAIVIPIKEYRCNYYTIRFKYVLLYTIVRDL